MPPAPCPGAVPHHGRPGPLLSSLRYDTDAYEHALRESAAPGAYRLGAAQGAAHCEACIAPDARVARGGSGAVALCKGRAVVDVESDLRNITRPLSRSPACLHRLGEGGCDPDPSTARACGGGQGTRALRVEDTRLSNPPCTLRGTGWNRWEWLCQDPQSTALLPFDVPIDTSILMKDNHRPHLPAPLDPGAALPPRVREPPEAGAPVWMPRELRLPADQMPTPHWRTCAELSAARGGCVQAA